MTACFSYVSMAERSGVLKAKETVANANDDLPRSRVGGSAIDAIRLKCHILGTTRRYLWLARVLLRKIKRLGSFSIVFKG